MVREQRERENTRLRMIRYRGKRNKNEKVTSVSSVAVAVSSSNTTKTDTTTTPSGVVDKAKKEPADLMVTELQKMFAGKLKEVTGSGAGFSWGQSGAMFKRLLKLEDITSIQSAIDNWFCSKDEFIKNNLTHLGVFEKKFYVLKKGAIDGYGKSNQKIIGYHN
jgi:hypothetical protein